MESIIEELDKDYRLDHYRIKPNLIVFEISSRKTHVKCPYCGADAYRVHSTYQREVQDLPMQDKKTVLLITTRKFFCDNADCSKKTFSEPHAFVEKKGKKTVRLEKNIIYTSTQLSSVNASKILKANSIDISKSSLCVLLKKNANDCG